MFLFGLRRSVVSAVQQFIAHAPVHGGEDAPPAPQLDAAELGAEVDPALLASLVAECAEVRDDLARRITAAGYTWPRASS